MDFQAQTRLARLEAGDYGTEISEGLYMQDAIPDPEPQIEAVEADAIERIRPKNRVERARVAGEMAAQLMDHFMEPHILNDESILNPIRDGIPQCRAHPFTKGSARDIGCIHSCGKGERDPAGNLPVARDYTVADVWQWVKALVGHAAEKQDKRTGRYMAPSI